MGKRKKQSKAIQMILLGLCLLLAGCVKAPPPPPPPALPPDAVQPGGPAGPGGSLPEEIRPKTAALFEITRTELIYLGKEEGCPVLLSPYEENRLYQVEDEANVLGAMPPFSQFSLASDISDGSVFLASCQTPAGRVPTVRASSFEEAAELYPQALLAYFQNSFCWQQYSLEDFAVGSARIDRMSQNHGRLTFACSVTPSYSPFDLSLGYFWSQGERGQTVQREVSLDLYGFNGEFSCSPTYPVFLEEVSEFPPEKEPLYEPPVYEDGWQAMVEGKETESVVFEEAPYSYVIGTRLSREGFGEIGLESGAFYSSLYRIDTQKGNRRKVWQENLPEGLIDLAPFAKKENWLFCTSAHALPYSESTAGPVIKLDLKTGEYETLLPRHSTVMGQKGDWFYFAVMGEEDGAADGVYRLDVKTEEAQRLCPLPAQKYNTAYYTSFVNYMDGADVYFSWPNESGLLQEYTLFLLDGKLGRLARLD